MKQSHKFNIGQTVQCLPRGRTIADRQIRLDQNERYTVSRLLPLSGFDPQYRIQAVSSGRERVVMEDELLVEDQSEAARATRA
jgi:hypothetical protein